MPARSVVSANTVCGSSPETKIFAQAVWATNPVAPRIARSGRKRAADTTNAVRTNAPTATPAENLRETTPSLLVPGSARLPGLANGRQRPHGDTGWGHVVIGHEEIRHQRHGRRDAILLEGAHAAFIEPLLAD